MLMVFNCEAKPHPYGYIKSAQVKPYLSITVKGLSFSSVFFSKEKLELSSLGCLMHMKLLSHLSYWIYKEYPYH